MFCLILIIYPICDNSLFVTLVPSSSSLVIGIYLRHLAGVWGSKELLNVVLVLECNLRNSGQLTVLGMVFLCPKNGFGGEQGLKPNTQAMVEIQMKRQLR